MDSKSAWPQAPDTVWGTAQKTQLAKDPKNPLSSLKKSAPEHIWKHFSNSSVGQKWGRGSAWRERVGWHITSWYQRTDRRDPHPPPAHSPVSSLWNTNLHADNLAVFASEWHLCVWIRGKSSPLHSGLGFHNCQEPSRDIPAIHVLTDRVKWTDKILVSIDEKYTRNHLVSGASDGWCVCHFLWWERSILTASDWN